MIKNSAVRVHEILNKLKAYPNDSLVNAWRKVLEVETLVDVFIGIGKIDVQLMVIEERYREKERATILIDPVIQEIRGFLNYERIDVSISAFVNSALKDANISTIGVAELIFDNIDGENTIEQAKLDQISIMIDELMKEMETLEIDKKIKKLFLKVLHEMKISIKFYEIDGVSAIEESLINLICKIKVIEENPITGSFVSKAKQFLGYVVETIATAVIEQGTESLYDSVIKGAIGN